MKNNDLYLNVVVAQNGKRENYLIPRVLNQNKMLAKLITGWYSPFPKIYSDLFSRLGFKTLSRLFGVQCPEIPRFLVHSFYFIGLLEKWRLFLANEFGNIHDTYVKNNRIFASAMTHLKLPPHQIFIAYSYAALEMLEIEKKRGVITILDQLDPGPSEYKLMKKEFERWPNYSRYEATPPKIYFDRVRNEWDLSDVIIVNSDFTKKSIISEGVDPKKIEVIPLAFENKVSGEVKAWDGNSPLLVLWIGQVVLRKGIQYLLEAAKILEKENVKFIVAGRIGLKPEVVKKAPKNIIWKGWVTHSQTEKLFKESHVFILPTLSEGFALTQIEAMAHGLPLIATRNCGKVIVNNKTGFIIQIRNPKAIVKTIKKFISEPILVNRMSHLCLESIKEFSYQKYSDRLIKIINNAVKNKGQS